MYNAVFSKLESIPLNCSCEKIFFNTDTDFSFGCLRSRGAQNAQA